MGDAPKQIGPLDYRISRVIDCARDPLKKAYDMLGGRTTTHCAVLVDGEDRVAINLYQHCIARGMPGPPHLKRFTVTTLTQRYARLIDVAAEHYDLSTHVETPVGPDELRVVVLTLGTLTVVDLDRALRVRGTTPTFTTRFPDVLCVATACWRGDRDGGFNLHHAFETRALGEEFKKHYEAHLVLLRAAGITKDAAEAELAELGAPGRELSVKEIARLFALVAWLEIEGHIPIDDFNGCQFFISCEWNLIRPEEFRLALGAPSKKKLN